VLSTIIGPTCLIADRLVEIERLLSVENLPKQKISLERRMLVSRPGLEPGTTALKVRLRAIPQLLPAKNQALSDIAFAVACGRFVFFGARHGARQAEAWRLYRHAPFSSLGKRAPPFTTPEGRRVQFPSEAFLRHTLLCFEALSNLEAQGRYGAPVMRKTCALILLVKSPRKL
jgi:hypothetical protein